MQMAGWLLADLHLNGTVRIVFIAHSGGGNESPITAKNLHTAESEFVTYGLTPEQAASLREELERNKSVRIETSIEDSMAEKCRR